MNNDVATDGTVIGKIKKIFRGNGDRKAKFIIKNSKNDQFYFVFRAKNGQILCSSETYKAKQSVYKGITSLVSAILKGGKETTILDET